MNLKIKHILYIGISILMSSCAMENRTVKSTDETYEMATEELDDKDIIDLDDDLKLEEKMVFDAKTISANSDVEYVINTPLISEKLQDFHDLLALKNKHPEFTNDVAEQLKNYTKDSISNFETDEIFIIKNIRQLGHVTRINNSTKKIKLAYTKVVDNSAATDTIYAIISNKTIEIDGEYVTSNKVRFSKN